MFQEKILMIAATPFFSDRGCHIRILNQLKYLKSSGTETTLVTYGLGQDIPGYSVERSLKIPWYNNILPGASWHKLYLNPLLLFSTTKILFNFKPSIIHAHLYEGLLIAYCARFFTRAKAPIIFDCQGSLADEMKDYHLVKYPQLGWTYTFFCILEKILLYLPDQIICSSQKSQDVLVNRYKIKQDKIKIINDGFDPEIFNFGTIDSAKSLRAQLRIPSQNQVVIYSGSLSDAKGVRQLIQFLPSLIKTQPNTTLLCVGYGELAQEILTQYDYLIINRNLILTGQISYFDLNDYLKIADWAIDPKPGGSESSGKIINYLAAGLPVICLDSPNPNLEDQVINIKDFSEITPILAMNPPIRNCTLKIQEYSWGNLIANLITIYQETQEKFNYQKNYFKRILLVLIFSFGCLLIFFASTSYSELFSLLAGSSSKLILASLIIYIVLNLLRAKRLGIMNQCGSSCKMLSITAIHTTVNSILPIGLGEITYPYLMKKHYQNPIWQSIQDLIFVRLYDLSNLVLVILLLAFRRQQIIIPTILLFLVVFAQTKLTYNYFKQSAQKIPLTKKRSVSFYLYSALITASMICYAICLMLALRLNTSISLVIEGWYLSVLGGYLPIQGLFGFGPMEAGWIWPLMKNGLDYAEALSISVSYHLVSIFFSVFLFLFGSIYLYIISSRAK